MNTAYLSRVLQMLLQPLQGAYSTGTALITATSGDVLLDPGDVLVPIVRGSEVEAAAVKIDRNPTDREHGRWTITSAGTAVTVSSLQGGLHVNLPAGTQLRFDEPPTGIEELATVSVSLSGGEQLERFGALRQVTTFKDLGTQPDAAAFFRAQVGRFPAAVLQWGSMTPGDGSASPSLGVSAIRVGKGRRIYCNEWVLFIICSRVDSTDRRKREGDVIRDTLMPILNDRHLWRGVPLSSPVGIEVLEARVSSVSPTAYVDMIRFANWFVMTRTESRVFNDWLTTRLQMSRPTSAGDVEIVDSTFDMPGH